MNWVWKTSNLCVEPQPLLDYPELLTAKRGRYDGSDRRGAHRWRRFDGSRDGDHRHAMGAAISPPHAAPPRHLLAQCDDRQFAVGDLLLLLTVQTFFANAMHMCPETAIR